jgi:hypothetical protein
MTNENHTAYIYGLVCPLSGGIRYIGKSIRPKERLQNHMNEKSKCHRSNWLALLKAIGLKPTIVILEEVSDDQSWQDREKHWISHGKELGWKLTNNTSGGDGVVNLHPDSRERIRTAWIGRKHRPESLIRIGIASTGRTHSDEWKTNMSDIMKKREITWGAKIAIATRKLTSKDQTDIINLLSDGVKNKDIANMYGVHRTTVSKVKTGKYVVK